MNSRNFVPISIRKRGCSGRRCIQPKSMFGQMTTRPRRATRRFTAWTRGANEQQEFCSDLNQEKGLLWPALHTAKVYVWPNDNPAETRDSKVHSVDSWCK